MAATTKAKPPEIQLIANLIVKRGNEILFVRYDPEDDAWWLPGGDMEPYEHPDEAARRVFDDLGLKLGSMKMFKIDSFRGRRGWHVMFNYLVEATGEPKGDAPFAWHKPDKMPRTKHGTWEHDQVKAALK